MTLVELAQTPELAVELATFDAACFEKDAWSEARWREEFGPNLHIIGAYEDGKLVGYAGWVREGDRGHLISNAVLAEHRHRGVGTALLTKRILDAVRADLRTVYAETRTSNLASQRLLVKQGFTQHLTMTRYYGDEDGIVWKLTH